MLNLHAESRRIRLQTGDHPTGWLSYGIEHNGRWMPPQEMVLEQEGPVAVVRVRLPGADLEDRIREVEEGHLEITRRWSFHRASRVGLLFSWEVEVPAVHWMVPSVMYDGNPKGKGLFPRGGPEVGWSFREDRIAIPNGVYVSDGSRFGALYSSPATHEDEIGSIFTRTSDRATRLEVRIPYREAPRLHRQKFYWGGGLKPPVRKDLKVGPHDTVERTFHLLQGAGGRLGYDALIRSAWDVLPSRPWAPRDWGRFAWLKARHVERNFLLKRRDAYGFVTMLGWFLLPILNSISGGFLGKNLEIARCLYELGLETDHEPFREAARRTADFFLTARIPGGLLLGDYLLFRNRWVGSVFRSGAVSTRMMAEMASQYLLLAQAAGDDGAPAWAETAHGVCRFFLDHQLPNGSFGKWWSLDRRIVEDSGTASAFGVSLLLQVHRARPDPALLRAAIRGGAHLVREHVETGLYWGDALDSDCIDREGGVSVMVALLDLWDATGDRSWLDAARTSAWYLMTWTYAWDVPFRPRSPLGRRSFRTRAGTAVSVAHHHLDPYGIAIAHPFFRLARATGEELWARVAREMVAYSGQLVSTPEDSLGRSSIWVGWQPEQADQTDWDYVSPRIFGRGTFKNTVAWVPALTLGALLDLRRSFPEEMDFQVEPDVQEPEFLLRTGWLLRRLATNLSPHT